MRVPMQVPPVLRNGNRAMGFQQSMAGVTPQSCWGDCELSCMGLSNLAGDCGNITSIGDLVKCILVIAPTLDPVTLTAEATACAIKCAVKCLF